MEMSGAQAGQEIESNKKTLITVEYTRTRNNDFSDNTVIKHMGL